MKYRLLDLIVCPRCMSRLELSEDAVIEKAQTKTKRVFTCSDWCALYKRSFIPNREKCALCFEDEIREGSLTCSSCGNIYPIVNSIPWLLDKDFLVEKEIGTSTHYGYGWHMPKANVQVAIDVETHFDKMSKVVEIPIVRGQIGLDAGCGGGRDLIKMAEKNPEIEIVGIDFTNLQFPNH